MENQTDNNHDFRPKETVNPSSDETNFFKNRLDISAVQTAVTNIKNELRKVIVGQDTFIDLLIGSILADGHSLIEGVPGIAKTITAKLLAKTINTQYSRIQFTPDLMPSDVIGTSIFNNKINDFEFVKGPVFSNIVLIDEINRAPAKTQAALFEAMAERQITVDGKTYTMKPPFLVFATQNPIEQEGTYRLPEAQLDRFLFKIDVGYPSVEEEIKIIDQKHQRRNQKEEEIVQPVISEEEIKTYQHIVSQIQIESNLIKYIAEIVGATRNNPFLYVGASPRASLAILSASKAFALMAGRDFVTPEDIKKAVYPVMQHRIIITPEREMEGITSDVVLNQIVDSVEIPR
ncbi:MAG: AAA family ATPase [Flavobacteriales bacterium]